MQFSKKKTVIRISACGPSISIGRITRSCKPFPVRSFPFASPAPPPPSHGGTNPNPNSTPPSPATPSAPQAQNPKANAHILPPPPPSRGRLRVLRRRRRWRWRAPGGRGEAPGALPAGAFGDPVGGTAHARAGQRRGCGADGRAGLGRRVAPAAARAHLRRHLRRRRQVLLRRRTHPLRPHRAPLTFSLD